ncbi:MAG: LysR family transcriptional regulator [Alphaproteobacteria bacterium]|nr:LysR family transcriptional regulator [Alphaproteobacteria bacterium]
MTLEQLRIFVAVAERQHVTRAAAALGLAQSAVSAAIAALESRHRIKLFHRIGRGIALTDAGELFLIEARGVLARAETAEQRLSDLGGLKRGRLRLWASQTIAGYWLPRHLADFRRAYPGITIELSIGNTAEAAAGVLDGSADLGFAEGLVIDPLLSVTEVARDRLVLVVAPDHPWSARKRVALADFPQSDWVLREEGSGTRAIFEAALADAGVKLPANRVVMSLPSNEAVRGAAAAGLGAAVLSASVVAAMLEAEMLVAPRADLPDRAFVALAHTERYQSAAARALLDQIAGRRR